MTKQELINTYDSMSMPEEHVEAIEARLKKLYDNPSTSSAPEVPEESTRDFYFCCGSGCASGVRRKVPDKWTSDIL